MISQGVVMIGIVFLVMALTIGGLIMLIRSFKEAWEDQDIASLFVLTLITCLGIIIIGLLLIAVGL